MIQLLHHCTIELFLTLVIGTSISIIVTALTFNKKL